MLRYFWFLYNKRRILRFAIFILTLVAILTIGFIVGPTKIVWKNYDFSYVRKEEFNTAIFYVDGLVFLALCFIEPILIFSFKMDRNAFESERILPVSKETIFISRFILGYVEIIISYSLALFVSNFIFNSGNFLIYLVMHFGGMLVYSFFAFFFLRGRNIIDGIVLMIMATVSLILIGNGIFSIVGLIRNKPITIFEYSLNPFSIYEWIIVIMSDSINKTSTLYPELIIAACAFTAISFGTMIGIFITIKDFKVENASQKTESLMGYKILIPITFISLLLCKNFVGQTMYYLMLAISLLSTYFAYALSYRKFIFTKREWLIYSIVGLGEFAMFMISLFIF